MASPPHLAKTLANRAIHIKIRPRPRSITESRQILRVLERYGEVIMFKNLKYEPQAPAPNTALAIFKQSTAASQALRASPIHFTVGEVDSARDSEGQSLEEHEPYTTTLGHTDTATQTTPDLAAKEERGAVERLVERVVGRVDDRDEVPVRETAGLWREAVGYEEGDAADSAAQTSNTAVTATPFPYPKTPQPPPPPPFTPSPAPPSSPYQISLTISPSILSHKAYIARQGYYECFDPAKQTVMAEDLEKRVPMVGLRDLSWAKPELPLRLRVGRGGKRAVGVEGLGVLWRGRWGVRAEGEIR